MDNQAKIEAIIGKIAEGKHTGADLIQLRELLGASDSESLIQLGKNIVGKIDGREIQIGDRIYQGADAEPIREELRSFLQELRLVLQEKQKADAEAIKEELHSFLEQLRSVLQKPPIAIRPDHEKRLLEKTKRKIGEHLKELSDNVEPINLDKEWQQEQVEHPDDVDLNSRYQGTIGENKNIFDIFKDAHEQLLILGEPGSGKTTTMLVLAQALVNQAEKQSDDPIPVLLKLSSFKKEEKPIFYWFLEELSKQYYAGIDENIIKNLLIEDKLLLMLDALDELEENHRKNCVYLLNKLLKDREYFPENKSHWSPDCLVVCSRRQEYESLAFKLQLNRAICLQALSDAQIEQYLADRDRELRKKLLQTQQDQDRKKSRDVQEQPLFLEFWQTQQDQDRKKLRDVLQRPLFLKIACDAMTEISIDKLKSFTSLEDRQLYLSLSYMRSCLRKKSEDSKREKWCLLKESEDSKREKKIRLLIWLAQQLQNHGQTEFFIERMQPSWLPPGTRKWYVLLVALSIILILSLPIIVFICITRNFSVLNISLYMPSIIGILVIAVSASLDPKIKAFEDNIVNSTFCSYNIKLNHFGQVFVFVILFFVGLLIFLSLSTIPHYVVKLSCIILFCGLLMVRIARLNGHELQQKTLPNQGIRNSAINAACVAIPIAITVATGLSILSIKFPFKLFILQFLSSLLMIGLPVGLICALLYGGLTCIQHFMLRLILWCNEHPWNYAKFLDNAVKLKLLRRVGGRYEFIHSLLKEYFARLPDIIN